MTHLPLLRSMDFARSVIGICLRHLTVDQRLAVLHDVPEYREAVVVRRQCRCRQGDQPRMDPPETAVGESW